MSQAASSPTSFETLQRLYGHLWKMIEPVGNVRGPILRWIPTDLVDGCSEACIFFTATELKVAATTHVEVPAPEGEGVQQVSYSLVEADGYLRGPAGP